MDLLSKAGADVNQNTSTESAIRYADAREVAMKLLEAGTDPQELSKQGRRGILSFSPYPDKELLNVTVEEFHQFWKGLIRSGINAYQAAVHIENERNYERDNPRSGVPSALVSLSLFSMTVSSCRSQESMRIATTQIFASTMMCSSITRTTAS